MKKQQEESSHHEHNVRLKQTDQLVRLFGHKAA